MMIAEVILSQKWNDLLSFWNNPRLNNPIYSEEFDEIAWFDFRDHQTRVNKKNLEEMIGERHKEIILCHEIGHHVLIPHSQGFALSLINEAYKATKSAEKAKLIENLFDDIIVNTFIARKSIDRKQQLVEAYQDLLAYKASTQKKGVEKLFDVYMRVYEILWQLNPGTLGKHNSGFEQDAQEIASIINHQIFNYSTWPNKIRKFSKIIEKYIEEDHLNNSYRLIFDKTKMKKDQAIREAARKIPFKELKALAGMLGLGTPQEIVKNIYEGMADQYKILFPKVKTMSGEEQPFTPTIWTPEDPLEKLDFFGTIVKQGIIIPEVTTQQWIYERGINFHIEDGYPDLLIVLDTSGSMKNPNEDISYAHLSALVACNSALGLGSKVSVINFSSNVIKTIYTRDREILHDPIFKYQEGGTCIPGSDIYDIVMSNSNRQHILVITDAGISNLATEGQLLIQALQKAGSGTLFLVGGSNDSEEVKTFRNIGYKVESMNSEQDLLSHTVKDMEEVYQ